MARFFFYITFTIAIGCGINLKNSGIKPHAQVPPHLAALSQYEANLGTPITGYGTGFPASLDDGHLQLVFNGEFQRGDGRTTSVHTAVEVRTNWGSEFVWNQLGPYGHPFTTRGDELGTFRGTAGARLITRDNKQIEDPAPIKVNFTILPSILVRGFSPITADCKDPVQRAFGALPYLLTVEAIGFMPRSITYVVSIPELGYGDTPMTHNSVTGTSDSVTILPPAVPNGRRTYSLLVRVRATDSANRIYDTGFAIGVHQPVEIVYDQRTQIAEIYAPEVVSGCMQGGVSGRTVQYTETMTDSLTKSMTLAWDHKWLASHSVSSMASKSLTQGFSFTTGHSVTDSHSDSNTTGWSLSDGFTVSSEDGRSGSWKIDASSSNTDTGIEQNTLTNGEVKGTNFTLEVGIPLGGKVKGYSSNGFYPLFSWGHKYTFTDTHDDTEGTETSATDKVNKSQNMGASASVSQKHSTDMTLNGSETTTDLSSFTSFEDQTKSLSQTQTNAEGTVVTTLTSMGMSMGNTDSTSASNMVGTSFSANIIAGNFAVFYRQFMRLSVHGSIVAYNQCGAGDVVGEVGGTKYTWAPELAQGAHCSPLPRSTLPPYQCLMEPCTRMHP